MEGPVRKLWIVVGVVALVGILGATALGAIAFAQEEENGTSWPFDFRQKVHDAIAGALGLGAEEYDAAVDTARQQVLDEAVSEGVLTEEQAELMGERMAEGMGPGGKGGFGSRRGGMMGRAGGFGGMMGGSQSSLLSVAAETLNMSVEDLTAALENENTNTIAAVATANGVDPQAIVDAFVAQRAEWLAESVADGRITQEQADYMLDHMEEEVLEHINTPFTGTGVPGGCFGGEPGSFRRGGGMMGPGGLRAYPGTDES
jgi:polyhydroxyalkanoate synthesis regulator phasin